MSKAKSLGVTCVAPTILHTSPGDLPAQEGILNPSPQAASQVVRWGPACPLRMLYTQRATFLPQAGFLGDRDMHLGSP